jgi:hypothetical protein
MHLTNTFYEMAVSKTVLTEGTVLFGPFILQIDTWQMTQISGQTLTLTLVPEVLSRI